MKKIISVGLVIAVLSSLLIATSAQAAPSDFDVYAFDHSSSGTGVGLDTGITLNTGDFFTVTVDPNDLWSAGDLPRWSNADGLVGDLCATEGDDSGESPGTLIGQDYGTWTDAGKGLTAPYGTLVGEINGTYFVLGTSYSGPAPASGNLKLYYWDGNNEDNTEYVTVTVDTSIPVNIDIKPGSDPNSINLGSKGVIPVAILTTESFDASTVNSTSVMFGPDEASPVHYSMDDVDDDGDQDMILHFRTQEIGLTEDDTEATLTGETLDGVSIHGTDSVRIVPSESKGNPQGKAMGKADAPGQNKLPGERAIGKAKGKASAPGQNK